MNYKKNIALIIFIFIFCNIYTKDNSLISITGKDEAIEYSIKELNGEIESDDRAQCLYHLAENKAILSADYLINIMENDKDAGVRAATARFLIKLTKDKEREKVLFALRKNADKEVKENDILFPKLNVRKEKKKIDRGGSVQYSVMLALAQYGDRESITRYKKWLKEYDINFFRFANKKIHNDLIKELEKMLLNDTEMNKIKYLGVLTNNLDVSPEKYVLVYKDLLQSKDKYVVDKMIELIRGIIKNYRVNKKHSLKSFIKGIEPELKKNIRSGDNNRNKIISEIEKETGN